MLFTYPQVTQLMRVVHTCIRRSLVRQAYQFLPVIVAHVHLSLQQEYQDLLFRGICNGWKWGSLTTSYSWTYRRPGNTHTHTHTGPAQLFHLCVYVFLRCYSIKSLLKRFNNQTGVQLWQGAQISCSIAEQTRQVMLVPLLKCIADTKVCSVIKRLVC